LAEGLLARGNNAEKDNGQALDDDLFGYKSTAGSSQGECARLLRSILAHGGTDELIVLESDSRSEDGDDNLDTTCDLRTLDGGQLAHTAPFPQLDPLVCAQLMICYTRALPYYKASHKI
jgi:hypothetical protein